MRRLRDSPIVEFGSVPGYGPIFNAGAINVEGTFHLFARGVRDGYERNAGEGARFLDYVSDVLVFTSAALDTSARLIRWFERLGWVTHVRWPIG